MANVSMKGTSEMTPVMTSGDDDLFDFGDRAEFGFFFESPATQHLYYLLPYIRATKHRSVMVFSASAHYLSLLRQAFADIKFVSCGKDLAETRKLFNRYSVIMFSNGYPWFVRDVQPVLPQEILLVRVIHGSGHKFCEDAGYYAGNVYAWDALVVLGRKDLDQFYEFYKLPREQRQYHDVIHLKRGDQKDFLMVQSGNLRINQYFLSRVPQGLIRERFPFVDPEKKTVLVMFTHPTNANRTVDTYSGLTFFVDLLNAMDGVEDYNFLFNLHPELVKNHDLLQSLMDVCGRKAIPVGYEMFVSDYLVMMNMADALIVDQTSAVFDFLHFNKPVVFLDNRDEYHGEIAWDDTHHPFWSYRNGPVVSPSNRDSFEDILASVFHEDTYVEVRERSLEYSSPKRVITAELVMSSLLTHPKVASNGVAAPGIQQAINRAMQRHKAGELGEAEKLYRQILKVDPRHPYALHFLGLIAHQVGKDHIAEDLITKAITIKPDFPEAYNSLGLAFAQMDRLEEAVVSYEKSIALVPDNYETHHNLGDVYLKQEHLEDAVSSFQKALEIKPDYAEAHCKLGSAFQKLGQLEDAAAGYNQAIALRPDFPEAHNCLGLLQLLSGDFQNGWQNYFWRWKVFLTPRDYKKPLWDGSEFKGKTIFVYPEQGLGDVIQFARYLPLVAASGGRVVFEAPEPLWRLFQDTFSEYELLKPGEIPQQFDCHAPLMDIARLMKTTLESIPNTVPYLRSSPGHEKQWANRLHTGNGFRLGIAWAGKPSNTNDHNRSIEASLLRPLTEIPGVSVFSFQVGRNGEATENFGDKITDIAPHLTDFAHTAAAMNNMDLIISADTSVVHLAGALGQDVWTLLPFLPDWRWLLERDDSPWYPTMRLFRQNKRGDWVTIIERVCEALMEHLRNTQD